MAWQNRHSGFHRHLPFLFRHVPDILLPCLSPPSVCRGTFLSRHEHVCLLYLFVSHFPWAAAHMGIQWARFLPLGVNAVPGSNMLQALLSSSLLSLLGIGSSHSDRHSDSSDSLSFLTHSLSWALRWNVFLLAAVMSICLPWSTATDTEEKGGRLEKEEKLECETYKSRREKERRKNFKLSCAHTFRLGGMVLCEEKKGRKGTQHACVCVLCLRGLSLLSYLQRVTF